MNKSDPVVGAGNGAGEQQAEALEELLRQALVHSELHGNVCEAVSELMSDFLHINAAWEEAGAERVALAQLTLDWMKLAGRLGSPQVPGVLREKWLAEEGKLTGPLGIKGRRWRQACAAYWQLHGVLTGQNAALRSSLTGLIPASQDVSARAQVFFRWAKEAPGAVSLLAELARKEEAEEGALGEDWLTSISAVAEGVSEMQKLMQEAYDEQVEDYSVDLSHPYRPE